jgi:hypothetical protein
MPLIDYARGVVLEGFKDENLDKHNGSGRAAQLRRVPPEQRQNVMAEMERRCFVAVRGGENSNRVPIKGMSPDEVIEDILRENGW